MELIGLQAIQEICITTILTGQLRDGIPLSILLVGPSGAGKSKTILRLEGEMIHRADDLTAQGLWAILSADRESKITHIILGDFNLPLSHKTAVSGLTVASMLTIMSDGTMRLDDGRTEKLLQHAPVGFISGVTDDMYLDSHNKWRKLGILRRLLGIHYTYCTTTKEAAQAAIASGKVTLQQPPPIKILKLPQRVHIPIHTEQSSVISSLSLRLSTNLGQRVTWARRSAAEIAANPKLIGINVGKRLVQDKPLLEFSPHLFLRAMAQAHALYRHKAKVEAEDVEFLKQLIDFTNPGQPKLL
jgi:energy-coupling factor transporter ATP-binding protein EcfA2